MVEAGLEQLGGRVATTSVVPLTPLVSCLEAVAPRFYQEIANILITLLRRPGRRRTKFPFLDSWSVIPTTIFTNDAPILTKAPGNCNSKLLAYAVTWTIKGQSVSVTVPDVTSKAVGSAEMPKPDTAFYILAQNSLYGQVETGPTGTNAQVYQAKTWRKYADVCRQHCAAVYANCAVKKVPASPAGWGRWTARVRRLLPRVLSAIRRLPKKAG